MTHAARIAAGAFVTAVVLFLGGVGWSGAPLSLAGGDFPNNKPGVT